MAQDVDQHAVDWAKLIIEKADIQVKINDIQAKIDSLDDSTHDKEVCNCKIDLLKLQRCLKSIEVDEARLKVSDVVNTSLTVRPQK